MTFVLNTAVFNNGAGENLKIPKINTLNHCSLKHALVQTVIKIWRN